MSYLYSPITDGVEIEVGSRKFDYSFRLKKGSWKLIKDSKGWKSDSEGARELGFTKGYISSILSNREEISHEFMVRLAVILGNIDRNWWIHFELSKDARKGRQNHQKFNLAKYQKQLPYSPYSVAAVYRSGEHPVEVWTSEKEIKVLDNRPEIV